MLLLNQPDSALLILKETSFLERTLSRILSKKRGFASQVTLGDRVRTTNAMASTQWIQLFAVDVGIVVHQIIVFAMMDSEVNSVNKLRVSELQRIVPKCVLDMDHVLLQISVLVQQAMPERIARSMHASENKQMTLMCAQIKESVLQLINVHAILDIMEKNAMILDASVSQLVIQTFVQRMVFVEAPTIVHALLDSLVTDVNILSIPNSFTSRKFQLEMNSRSF